jgi:rod shape-determining protein MreD
MIGAITSNLFRIIGLVLLQALVIDHMDLANGWVAPYLYVLGILLLPFDTPPWASLLAGFGSGYLMDLFSSTPGLHAGACTVMGFARPYVLRLVAPRDGYEFGRRPTLAHMGMAWFLTYAGLLVAIHHLWLFYAEVYRFSGFFSTLLRALLSVAATLCFCLLTQAFSSRVRRVRT